MNLKKGRHLVRCCVGWFSNELQTPLPGLSCFDTWQHSRQPPAAGKNTVCCMQSLLEVKEESHKTHKVHLKEAVTVDVSEVPCLLCSLCFRSLSLVEDFVVGSAVECTE